MANSISIGQYLPGNSLVHRLDPRFKIIITIVFMVSVFICKNYLAIGVLVAASVFITLMSKIKPKVILKGLKPMIFIVIITSLFNLFYGVGDPVVQIGIIKITAAGINNAIFMAMRILVLVVFGLILTYTTSPTQLTSAMESLLKPLTLFKVDVHTFAMTMTIALRFIPTLTEEVQKIISAQKSRGADLDTGNIFKRIKAVVPIMIPLFVSAFRRANDLEYAMDCRCYHGGNGRTKMNKLKATKLDAFAFVATIAYMAAIILIRIFTKSII